MNLSCEVNARHSLFTILLGQVFQFQAFHVNPIMRSACYENNKHAHVSLRPENISVRETANLVFLLLDNDLIVGNY